jgi:integrase
VEAGAPTRPRRRHPVLSAAVPTLAAPHRHHPRSLDAGAALRDVQDYAGHRDPRTTRRYDHARDTLDRNAAYTLTAYLS